MVDLKLGCIEMYKMYIRDVGVSFPGLIKKKIENKMTHKMIRCRKMYEKCKRRIY
jgi:hypothetical protein